MEVKGVIEGVFIVTKMVDHVNKMRISIKSKMIPIINMNLLKNDLYLHLHRL